MTDIVNELDDLLDRIQTPPLDVAGDIARGERALRHRHGWQIGAAALAVVAVSGAGVALMGAGGTPQAGFSAQPSQTAGTLHMKQQLAQQHVNKHVKQEVKQRRLASTRLKEQVRRLQNQVQADYENGTLQTFHDVLAEHLDPTGQLLKLAKNEHWDPATLPTAAPIPLSFRPKLTWSQSPPENRERATINARPTSPSPTLRSY